MKTASAKLTSLFLENDEVRPEVFSRKPSVVMFFFSSTAALLVLSACSEEVTLYFSSALPARDLSPNKVIKATVKKKINMFPERLKSAKVWIRNLSLQASAV